MVSPSEATSNSVYVLFADPGVSGGERFYPEGGTPEINLTK